MKMQKMIVVLLGALMLPLATNAVCGNDHPENTVTKEESAVNGVVTNTKGETLIGVVVSNVANGQRCSTNVDGHFSIRALPRETLVFSYVGFILTKK